MIANPANQNVFACGSKLLELPGGEPDLFTCFGSCGTPNTSISSNTTQDNINLLNDQHPASMGATAANPQDSMKSTWRQADRKTWTRHHYLLEYVFLSTNNDQEVPVHQKTEMMPYLPHWKAHIWILLHAGWPLILQQLWVNYTGHGLHPIATFVFYSLAFKLNAISEIRMLRRLGQKYGFLDGDKHARDEVPDVGVSKTAHALQMTSTFRPLITLALAYRSSQAPDTISWWTPVELGLYGIILDFWFYWYHRFMHEYDGLWKYHRTHHLTKHPNPLLTIYADHEQEIFDIAVIPLLTYGTLKLMGFPMGFYDWWICHQYIVFTELFGHSGVRVFMTPPSTNSLFLRLFKAELATEDHDLHHRKGWRKSMNYGKQTLLWDRLFGTAGDRIEMADHLIDYKSQASMF